MKTTVIMYEDLDDDDEILDNSGAANFTISLPGHQPAVLGRKKIYCRD